MCIFGDHALASPRLGVCEAQAPTMQSFRMALAQKRTPAKLLFLSVMFNTVRISVYDSGCLFSVAVLVLSCLSRLGRRGSVTVSVSVCLFPSHSHSHSHSLSLSPTLSTLFEGVICSWRSHPRLLCSPKKGSSRCSKENMTFLPSLFTLCSLFVRMLKRNDCFDLHISHAGLDADFYAGRQTSSAVSTETSTSATQGRLMASPARHFNRA